MADKLKKVIDKLDEAADSFDGIANKEQRKIFDEVVLLAKDLDTDIFGRVKQSIGNLKRLTAIKAKLAALSKDKEWVDGIAGFARYFGELQRLQNDFYSANFPQQTLSARAKEKNDLLRQMAVQNTMEALMGDGLKANVTDKLNDILLRAVTTGAKFADLQEELRGHLLGKDGGQGAFARYATTYATTALSQYTGQHNKLMTDDLGTEWFMYTGSNKETTREFCEHLTAKKYVHKSEIPEILKGKIDGYQCAIYDKTGLPYGMIAGTTPENFQCNCGGWNCRHQLVPVADAVVPENIRNKYKQIRPIPYPKEGKEGLKLGRAQKKEVYQQINNIPLAVLSDKQTDNIKKAASLFGIKYEKPMSFMEADGNKSNLDYNKVEKADENCVECIIVYEMRRRGLDLTAMPYDEENEEMKELQSNFGSIWRNEKDKIAQVTKHKGGTYEEMKRKMLNQCKAPGRYHIGLNWRVMEGDIEKEKGHVLVAERLEDGSFIYHDPQDGSFTTPDEYNAIYGIDYLESIKVDKLIVDEKKLKAIARRA